MAVVLLFALLFCLLEITLSNAMNSNYTRALLDEDARGRHHEFIIVIDNHVTNGKFSEVFSK